MNKHPRDTPLSEWSDGWLVMETASLLDTPGYVLMSDAEREREGYPSSRDERADFIASAAANPDEGLPTADDVRGILKGY